MSLTRSRYLKPVYHSSSIDPLAGTAAVAEEEGAGLCRAGSRAAGADPGRPNTAAWLATGTSAAAGRLELAEAAGKDHLEVLSALELLNASMLQLEAAGDDECQPDGVNDDCSHNDGPLCVVAPACDASQCVVAGLSLAGFAAGGGASSFCCNTCSRR